MMNVTAARTIDLGNNETRTIGIVADRFGFVALTLSRSRTFKTHKGAAARLARRGYSPNGDRIAND